jgi:hypothetical protein
VRELFLDRFSAAEQRALAGYWERLAPGAAHGDEADGC